MDIGARNRRGGEIEPVQQLKARRVPCPELPMTRAGGGSVIARGCQGGTK